jgi:hypothetical protein
MALAAGGALLLSGVSAGGSYAADVLPGLLVLDLGVGLAASGIFITGMAGVGHDEAGVVSGLLTTAHEVGAALVLPILSTIAVSGIGPDTIPTAADPATITSGIGDAFAAAVIITSAASLLALVALRRNDVAPGTQAAFAHH